MVQGGGVEWADLEGHDAVSGQRASKLLHKEAVESRTPREEQPDALGPKPPAGEGKATGRGRVEPLDVVDRNDDGALVGECAERVEEREADRVRIWWRPLVVPEDERQRERSSLACRESSERLVEYGVQKIADAGERQRCLALGRARQEDAERTVARLIETGLPESGLSDPGLAFERKRPSTLRDGGHEPAHGLEFDVPSHDAGGHDPTIVRRCAGDQAPPR